MRPLRKIIASTLAFTISFSSFAQEYVTYTVKTKQSLSKILQDSSITPIYGENGTLKKTLLLNPHLRKNEGHLIFPGQKILLPLTKDFTASPVVAETESRDAADDVAIPTAPTPTYTPEIPTEESDKASAQISLAVGTDFFRIEGVDQLTKDKSEILSEASPFVAFGYNLVWNELTTVAMTAKYQRFQLQDLNDGQGFDEQKGKRMEFAFKVIRKLSDRWSLAASLNFDQDLFFHASSPSELNVSKVLITKPGLHARYLAFQKSNAAIGLEGKVGLNLSNKTDDYKIKNGNQYGFGTFFSYQNKSMNQLNKSLEARVFYSINNQDTSVTTREMTNLSFMLVYDWRLDW